MGKMLLFSPKDEASALSSTSLIFNYSKKKNILLIINLNLIIPVYFYHAFLVPHEAPLTRAKSFSAVGQHPLRAMTNGRPAPG